MSRILFTIAFSSLALQACWISQETASGGDADTDGDTDVDSDTDSDTDTDTDTDTGTFEVECHDPCLDEEDQPITGCQSSCGGMPDPDPLECPAGDFVCVSLQDVDDAPGMCLPPGALECEVSGSCVCFPEFSSCQSATQETVWTCSDYGQCVATCEP